MRRFKQLCAGSAFLGAAGSAFAVDDPVVGAFTTLATTIGTYSAGLIALAVVGVTIGVGVKYVKKAKGAA